MKYKNISNVRLAIRDHGIIIASYPGEVVEFISTPSPKYFEEVVEDESQEAPSTVKKKKKKVKKGEYK